MDLIKLIAELLGLKSEPESVTLELLEQAEAKARENFAAAKTSGSYEDAKAATEAVKAITTERTNLETAAADLEQKMADLEAEIAVSDQPDSDENSDEDADADKEDDAEEDKEPEAVAPVASPPAAPAAPAPDPAVPVTVAADAAVTPPVPAPAPAPAPAPKSAAAKPTPKPSAVPTPVVPLVTITAGGDVEGHSAGAPMSIDEIGPAFVATADAVIAGRHGARKSVAKVARSPYPNDRSLSERDSVDTNTEKINNAVMEAQVRGQNLVKEILAAGGQAELSELTAEGGLCAPVNVRYDIFTVGTDARPLRDSFTRFGATRGGIRWNTPPTLVDVDGSVQITTEAQDADGSTYPKDCLRIDCGADNEVAVSAISLCMTTGNYSALFYPEQFRAWWGLGGVHFARTAETNLWNRMETLSTAVTAVTPADELSAVPDILATMDRALAQYRFRHRILPSTTLRLRTQAWVQDYLRADLARRQPGDSTLAVTNAEIARYFAARNALVTFVLDANSPGGTSGDVQAAGALNPWPDKVEINISVEGVFLYLDGPSLNFGTEIRDFDMIKQNDVGAFRESFEELALVGPTPVHVTIDTCPRGMTAGQNDSYDPCGEGS